MEAKVMFGKNIKRIGSKKITFVPIHLGIDEVEVTRPKPSKFFMPEHFKTMPTHWEAEKTKLLTLDKTARICPSFHEIFTEGFVLPAHCDMHFFMEEDKMHWTVSDSDFKLTGHPSYQYIDFMPNKSIKAVYKIPYPYMAVLPKGYSVRQVPMIYHHNTEWEVAYGTYRGDQISDIQLQLFIKSEKDEVLIKQGEPLCYFIPFKREKFSMEIKKMNDKYQELFNASQLKQRGKFKGAYFRNTHE